MYETLRRIPIFSSLPQDELEHVGSLLCHRNLPPETVIFREGDRGDSFYLILDGELEVIKALGSSDERLLARKGPGEYVGEMSLFEPHGLRTAAVRTAAHTRVFEMTHADFDRLMRQRPAIAYEVTRALSLQLHHSDNATIRDLQEKNRQLADAYEELKAAQLQIIEKERLEKELEVAREIQRSILPGVLPELPGFDFGAKMVPARAVGGDFFDFICLDSDRVGIAVGDVSDKGVPAAIFMAMTRSLVRAEAGRSCTPREALEKVNEHLLGMNDAEMFVTILYGVLNRSTKRFSYARAGHLLPVFCQPDGSITTPPSGKGQSIGLFANPPVDEQSIDLRPGATLLIYTDGMTEAVNDKGEFFGLERLTEAVRSMRYCPAQGICDRLIQALFDYQGTGPQHDDLTLVAVKMLG